jgi:Flp pilus assembly pilin Flp
MRIISKSFILSIKDSEGASAVEYAILIGLISAVIIATVGFLGTNTREGFDSVIPAFSTEEQKECPDGAPKDHDCRN